DDADGADRQREEIGELRPHQKWVLTRGPDRQLALTRPLGYGGVRLQRVLVDGREGVFAFDGDRRLGEDRLDVSPREGVVIADIPRFEANLPQAVKESGAKLCHVVEVWGVR